MKLVEEMTYEELKKERDKYLDTFSFNPAQREIDVEQEIKVRDMRYSELYREAYNLIEQGREQEAKEKLKPIIDDLGNIMRDPALKLGRLLE